MTKSNLALVRDNKITRAGDLDGHTRQKSTGGPGKVLKSRRIGGPPLYFGEDKAAVWNEVRCALPWLRENHRIMFELYVSMIAKFRLTPDDFTQRDASVMMRCADRLGGNPVSDQYIEHESDPEQDEFLD
jgi:hypothetical protein